jgi:hypothetical protein
MLMLFLGLLAWTAATGAVQKVKLTTSRNAGETLSFEVSTMTSVTVDWGDGEAVTYQDGEVTGELKGQTVTITGDEFMTGLDVSGTDLTAVNLTDAQQLLSLDCSDNQLTSLSLSRCSQLRQLDCSNNQIAELGLSNNSQLRVLNCSNNKLTSLTLTRNTYLEQLICDNNALANVSLTNNSYLQSVWCADNQIEQISITRGSDLYSLYAPNNKLRTIILNDASSLEDAWCENNELETIDFGTTTNLFTFNADSNQLKRVILGGITATKGPHLLSYANNKLGLNSFYPPKKVNYYYYVPQDTLQFGEDTLEVNKFIEFDEYICNASGSVTGIIAFYRTIDNSELTKGLGVNYDFYVRNNTIKFWKPQGEIYAVITSNQYPELRLVTTPFVAGVIPEGIHSLQIDSNNEEGAYYDLQGRRVVKPQGGIYVKDGKKVIVK